MGRILTIAALTAWSLALAGCNKGTQQAAGDHAVAQNTADATTSN